MDRFVKWSLIGITLVYLSVILVLPLVVIFLNAFHEGIQVFLSGITDPDTVSAIQLTGLIAVIVVPMNLVFGVAAAWTIAKFEFKGKQVLSILIDIPLVVSPVISGMIFVLLLGPRSSLGAWFLNHGIKIIFSTPGIALATTFITVPIIARVLIPMMQAQGREEEEAAITLGANGFQTFMKVTLPNIKWGLLYGVILCNARAMGEFGAVSVVSGHIRGLTNTLPLQVEIMYNEYNFAAAFAAASLLTTLGLLTLVIKKWVEINFKGQLT